MWVWTPDTFFVRNVRPAAGNVRSMAKGSPLRGCDASNGGRLFHSAEAAAGMRSGIACASAFRSTSTMRCEVSTLAQRQQAEALGINNCPEGAMRRRGA